MECWRATGSDQCSAGMQTFIYIDPSLLNDMIVFHHGDKRGAGRGMTKDKGSSKILIELNINIVESQMFAAFVFLLPHRVN